MMDVSNMRTREEELNELLVKNENVICSILKKHLNYEDYERIWDLIDARVKIAIDINK